MKSRLYLLALAFVFVASQAQAKSKEEHHEAKGGHGHWSYQGEGGPEHWGELSPEFAACKTGKEQSPINIVATETADLPALVITYKPTPLAMENNGHTIKLDVAPGSTLTVGDSAFDLLQFHFHLPSEEMINGKAYDLVAHLVHQDKAGKLGVVAILFTVGAENPVLAQFWGQLPKAGGEKVSDPAKSLDLNALLPKNLGYYGFTGSLTTPPCSEGVAWHVLKTPVEFSAAQKAAFAALYSGNARPVQPQNARVVKASK
ncbi:MAG: hypothetical protein A2557_01230 [Candidatus Lambdaproteobacteria bacterium RIFOXYD2_FULL_56_26]|uniref:carbonic anhydrase n=1 Tax=Candidatus Lambdaproteobacteria bacterium RIFOXYD2_FULL_56_26 TaxID=1817773 RepID=A0A1F6GZH9_9PROT|nr:MAG: hypothetical protein A2426_08510 [Candidatus Lambdaproteobacteria bacterium RIFOXYC1_FULL_56_13]OGH03557.1 MAG: hypothetical protein A2557_01230 [Candidatus Lambdaproteobacteria bacterium RIFOXYD2_FULL_56_26]